MKILHQLHDIYNTILNEIVSRKLAGSSLQKADPQPKPSIEQPAPEKQDQQKPDPITYDKEHFQRNKILTAGSNNPKTAHGIPGWESNILHLAPSHLAGCGTTCGAAGPGCIGSCLNTAGHGGMLPVDDQEALGNTHEARINKTRALAVDPEDFMHRMAFEIHNANQKAKESGNRLAMRLNGTSDLYWENYRPKSLDGKNIFEAFPDVMFYDYTKHPDRVMRNKHPNYHLTFSYSGQNEGMAKKLLAAGKNVAVVFGAHGSNTVDPKWVNQKLPRSWNGHEVIDGTSHDLRFLDGTGEGGKGKVVGLKALQDAQYDKSGFVVWNHEAAPDLGPKEMSEDQKKVSERLQERAKEMIKMSIARGRFSPDWNKDPTEGLDPKKAKHYRSRVQKLIDIIRGGGKKVEKKTASLQKSEKPGCHCAAGEKLVKCLSALRKTSKLAKFDGAPPPPPAPPMLDPSKVSAFQSGLFKAEKTPSTPKEQVYKNIQSKTPTHTHKGHPVKILHTINTKRGDYHTFEFMGGQHEGKWATGYGHELQPLKKGSDWKPWMDGNE